MSPVRYAIFFSAAIVSAATFGNTVWQSNRAKNTGAAVGNGNAALKDMSYWTNGVGEVGSGAPTADDDLVFDNVAASGGSPKRLRFNAGAVGKFAFNSLQIGTATQSSTVVLDGGSVSFANDVNGGLKLMNGNWFMNSGTSKSHTMDCDVEILAEDADNPFVIHYGQMQYSNNTLSVKGKLKGSEYAHLLLGPWPNLLGDTRPVCARNTTFALYDITDYAGTITVTSNYENVMADDESDGYGTKLRLMTGTTASSQAKLRISRGGSLSLQAFGGAMVTVKELSLACGSRLWFNHAGEVKDGKLWCVRATDALSVEKGEDKVEIFWKPIIRGNGHYRIPILVGPAGSTFTEDDFKISVSPENHVPGIGGAYNRDLHLEADDDPETGERTLYVVSHGFVYQISSYNGEQYRDGADGAPSSITNAAAWWGGLVPDPTNSAALYRTARSLRTLFAPGERYEFPCSGFWVNRGTLIIQTQTFEVPEFWCDGGTIGVGQGHSWIADYDVVSLIAPKIHFIGDSRTVMLQAYASNTFVVKGEIDGEASIKMLGFGGTGAPKCNFLLDGPNTNFTGSISVATDETRPAYHNFNSLFPTLYVVDGRNLGGKMATFDPRALTLTTLARLTVTNNLSVALEDGLNRGVYIKHTGRFNVEGTGVLDVKWPLLLSGKMWKEGAGTLILGGGTRHEVDDGGALTDIPRTGSNIFEVVNGTVRIANADALAGVETAIDAGASLELAIDPENADLTEYGIRNTSVDTPFTLDASFGGRLPLTLDNADATLPADCRVVTNALVTVKSASAQAVADMLSAVKPWRSRGFRSRIVPRANGDAGTTTLLLVSRCCGTALYLR